MEYTPDPSDEIQFPSDEIIFEVTKLGREVTKFEYRHLGRDFDPLIGGDDII